MHAEGTAVSALSGQYPRSAFLQVCNQYRGWDFLCMWTEHVMLVPGTVCSECNVAVELSNTWDKVL